VTTFERAGLVEYTVANDTEAILIDLSSKELRRKTHSQRKLALASGIDLESNTENRARKNDEEMVGFVDLRRSPFAVLVSLSPGRRRYIRYIYTSCSLLLLYILSVSTSRLLVACFREERREEHEEHCETRKWGYLPWRGYELYALRTVSLKCPFNAIYRTLQSLGDLILRYGVLWCQRTPTDHDRISYTYQSIGPRGGLKSLQVFFLDSPATP
jgi:hypothetical protein